MGKGFYIPSLVAMAICATQLAHGQQDVPVARPSSSATSLELDRAVAVVNNQVILASDLDLEMRLFHLLPINDRRDSSPPKVLERLTSRALIEQQILQEDPQGLETDPKDVEDSLNELRQNLPVCKRRDCNSQKGWAEYLETLGLTPEQVTEYWAQRMALLRFIEGRFRTGIRITPEEIQKYYSETLAPQYAKPDEVPALDKVSPRIQEILLQQQVTALFDDWLKSLKAQGQVEVLDPSLATAANPAGAPANPTAPKVPVPAPTAPAPKPPSRHMGGGGGGI